MEKIDIFIGDAVDEPVFLSDAPRPTARKFVLQRLGLPEAFERITHYCLNQIDDSDNDAAFAFDPKPKVLKKFVPFSAA